MSSQQAEEWRANTLSQLAHARDTGSPVRIEGHGSKSFYGSPVDAALDRLSTERYRGIVAYDPSELVVVARSGTPIAELESILAERQQRLAFEPPRFGGRGTVGGMVASGLSGPGRLAAGPCKDFILGLTVMNSEGALMRFGGTVMKNVAGYDVSRLHAGALGILGIILDVSMKVLPEPAARATVTISCAGSDAIALCDRWLSEPLPISATAWATPDTWKGQAPLSEPGSDDPSGLLYVRFAGAQAAVQAALGRFARDHGACEVAPAAADPFWESLRDQSLVFFDPSGFAQDVVLWRLSLPAQTSVLPIVGPTLSEWGGALRWVWSRQPAAEVRAIAQKAGGHATLYRAADTTRLREGAFAPLPAVMHSLHQRLKAELDPHHLFNPGRLYAGL